MSPEDVATLVAALGLTGERRGRDLWALCPNPAHGDSMVGSWHVALEGDKAGAHHCFACDFGGGPWELAAAVRGTTLREAGEWVRGLLGGGASEGSTGVVVTLPPARARGRAGMVLPDGVEVPSDGGRPWFPPALRYLTAERGVAEWQLARWHLGYAIRGRLSHRVVVPVYTGGALVSYVARAYLPRLRRYDVATAEMPGARPGAALFGEEHWDTSSGVVTLAEGVFGALALERAGVPNPTAILGAANLGAGASVESLEKVQRLAVFGLWLVATDPDAAGETCYERLLQAAPRWCAVRRARLRQCPDEAPEGDLKAAVRAALEEQCCRD